MLRNIVMSSPYCLQMRLGFVDESISDGRHFMGCLTISPATCSQLNEAVNGMLTNAANSHGIDLSSVREIHGKELWRGTGPWTGLSESERIALFEDLLRRISIIDFDLFFIGIDKEKMAQRYREPEPPHEIALKFLLEAIDRKLERTGNHALVICDEIGSPTEQNRYRERLREYRKFGTYGLMPRNLRQIADTLHFVPSDQSYGIQVIDILTFVHRRRLVHSQPSPAEINFMIAMRSMIQPHIVSERIWP